MKSLPVLALSAALAVGGCDKAAENGASGSSSAAGVTAPAGSAWTETFAVTPDGGMLMGNPNAPVKLVEYGALTCSHCAEFSEKSSVALKEMVAKGSVSFEYRNYLLNVLDVPASILARCGGPGPFFTISEQMFATQQEWLGRAQSITAAEQQRWQSLAPEQLAPQLAAKLGLDTFVQQRGIGPDKAKSCLSDRAAIDQLGKISERAQSEYKITGTPTFLINGQVVPETTTWEQLAPKLKEAGA
jgi:protein-disulfide isomerase